MEAGRWRSGWNKKTKDQEGEVEDDEDEDDADDDDEHVDGGPKNNWSTRLFRAARLFRMLEYERRTWYRFPPHTTPSMDFPMRDTPEEQVAEMNAWDYFRCVKFAGG